MKKQMDKTKQADFQKDSRLSAMTVKELGLEDNRTHGVDVSFAIWIRALLQNWRQGTLGCKNRSDVSLSTKKPWKQKGTGRARAGTARSPLWRGGGVIFGPQPRTRELKVNKKTKKNVLSALFYDYVDKGLLFVFDWELSGDKPSTSSVSKEIKAVGLADKKVTVLLDRQDYKYWASINNLASVQFLFFDDINPYELSLGNCIVVLKKDISMFNDMVARWN